MGFGEDLREAIKGLNVLVIKKKKVKSDGGCRYGREGKGLCMQV